MPPKGKAGQKAKAAPPPAQAVSSAASQPPSKPPSTVHEQTRDRFNQGRPYAPSIEKAGISGLSPAERTAWATAQFLGASATAPSKSRSQLSNKATKELWKHANELSLPLRAIKKPPPTPVWGRDRSGRDVGDYPLDDFRLRNAKRIQLTGLQVAHYAFVAKRSASRSVGEATESTDAITPADIQEERQRRSEIATLRMELYGQRTSGPYAQDPEWDDVEPVPIVEPEGALAAIAYPEEYAEAISYLRAVMEKQEHSQRALRLTEDIISKNPAHYTVWLYRFSIVNALQLPITDEIAWLNRVALANLKNYQIWHHRYLLAEYYYPQIADSPDRVAEFARSEIAFLTDILAADTKNYHVWSYRQYLVRKLGYWTDDERYSVEAFIRQDVRNNSAWSHRFFLVFSDPSVSSSSAAGTLATEKETTTAAATTSIATAMSKLNVTHDPAIPASIIDREVQYAEDQILKAPQNESPWNYLRGVLTKGNRPLSSIEAFASQFVSNIGRTAAEDIVSETVKSTHAMEVLAAIYAEKGDKEQAELYLKRLAEKWDPIRAGYWSYRIQQVQHGEETVGEA